MATLAPEIGAGRPSCSVLLTALLLCAGACSDEVGEPPPVSEVQSSWELRFSAPARAEVFAFVVDDGIEAETLRAQIATSYRSHDVRWVINDLADGNCSAPFDPAAFYRVDRTAIVVRPSADDSLRFVTPFQDPRLHWATEQPTQSPTDDFAAAAADALLSYEAPTGTALPILQSVSNLFALLTHKTAPITPAEDEVLKSIPPDAIVRILLASAREDESSAPAADYAVTADPGSTLINTLVLPAASPAPTTDCQYGFDRTTPRFEQWLSASSLQSVETMPWPCSGLTVFGPINAVDCTTRCLNRAPLLDASGRAQCRIQAQIAAERCPSEIGWLDPLGSDGARHPRTAVDDTGTTVRVCEIQQLEGDALTACRTTLACEKCTPGWCWTEVPELVETCEFGGAYPAFRFVGGSNRVPGLASVVCNVGESL